MRADARGSQGQGWQACIAGAGLVAALALALPASVAGQGPSAGAFAPGGSAPAVSWSVAAPAPAGAASATARAATAPAAAPDSELAGPAGRFRPAAADAQLLAPALQPAQAEEGRVAREPAYRNRAGVPLMIVGGALFLGGAIISGQAGDALMVGGVIVGAVGIYEYLQ